jgi:hypothetical protein
MTEFIKKNSILVGGIVVVFLGLVIYLNFFAGGPSGELLSSTEQASPVSQELLVVLSSLNTIRLDDSIFRDPAFQSLTNFGVELPPENVGRRNPFLPLGSN